MKKLRFAVEEAALPRGLGCSDDRRHSGRRRYGIERSRVGDDSIERRCIVATAVIAGRDAATALTCISSCVEDDAEKTRGCIVYSRHSGRRCNNSIQRCAVLFMRITAAIAV